MLTTANIQATAACADVPGAINTTAPEILSSLIPIRDRTYLHSFLQEQGADMTALMQSLLQTAPWNKRDNPAMMTQGHKLFQWASLKLYKRWDSMPELKALEGMRNAVVEPRISIMLRDIQTQHTNEAQAQPTNCNYVITYSSRSMAQKLVHMQEQA
eukprot:20895-Heterococcus_DN1.PRE.11